MYPYIAMAHQGIRVLAKMRPSREMPDEQQSFRTMTRESGSRGSDLEPVIAMALDDVKEIKKTVDADCKTFMNEVQEIRNHLNNVKEESEALESKLNDSLERLKNCKELFVRIIPETCMEADTVSELDHRLIRTWESEAEEKERKERRREEKLFVPIFPESCVEAQPDTVPELDHRLIRTLESEAEEKGRK